MLLSLPNVTLLGIDVINPRAAISAMRRSLAWTKFGDAVLLTNSLHPDFPQHGIRIVHSVQSNRAVMFAGITRKFFVDYELAVMTEPVKHFGPNTTHVLYCEADGGVINPQAWDESWLEYDFIGAPWPKHHDPGWPVCDGITNAVGNTGFSLQSRAFCNEVSAIASASNDPYRFSCDRWICRTIRPQLEERGIRFAPVDVAARFSCEARIYTGQFGYHGRGTEKLNGWTW